MTERSTHIRTCPRCEAMCGLEVHHADGEVKLIRPNRSDVWSKGYTCPKGTTLGHLHADPDRLRGVDEVRRIAAGFPPELVDVPSGNVAVNGIPVEVAPA